MSQSLVGRLVVVTWAKEWMEYQAENLPFKTQEYKVVSVGDGLIELTPTKDGAVKANITFFVPLHWILHIIPEPKQAPGQAVAGGARPAIPPIR